MNNPTTDDQSQIDSFGFNPAEAQILLRVSVEPISFKHAGTQGNDDVYTAIHSAYCCTSERDIHVHGFDVTIDQDSPSQSYNQLLKLWKLVHSAYLHEELEG